MCNAQDPEIKGIHTHIHVKRKRKSNENVNMEVARSGKK